jgi:hypothetical protein
MRKRLFRSKKPSSSEQRSAADYPTLDTFDNGRRDFLAKLGGVLLGAGALAACGDRSVNTTPPDPDYGHLAGVAPMPDAGIDGQKQPDPDMTVEGGVAPAPDAQIDKHDQGNIAGGAPMPDAQVDKKDFTLGGVARQPDAAGDKP